MLNFENNTVPIIKKGKISTYHNII